MKRFDAIDSLIGNIESRFWQKDFAVLGKIEKLLAAGLNNNVSQHDSVLADTDCTRCKLQVDMGVIKSELWCARTKLAQDKTN